MKITRLTTAFLAGFVLISAPHVLLAEQRPRNPGGGGGGGGGSSPGSGGGDSGGGTGRVASPRDGGGSPWGGGGVSSRPSEPRPSSGGNRRPARVSGGSGGGAGTAVPPYSRARGSAPVTGYGAPRGSVATLPPIISGPVYWGPDNWYFYPWGFGGLGLGYFWDPWMWSGFYGGMGGYGMGAYGMGGFGGYPWVDPYYGGGVGGGGWGGAGGGVPSRDDDDDAGLARNGAPNPLDPNAPTGGLRLKVEPRDAEVLVDGFLAGRVDDFDGAMQRLKITEGPHRVELRAPGYEPAIFSVTIVVGQTTTYRTELKRSK